MIELKSVIARRGSFTFGPFSHRFEKGRTIMVMGENGAGKTTLLDVISGMAIPDSGELVSSARISYAPQESDDSFFLPTVLDEFSYSLRGKRKDELKEIAQKLLSSLSLSQEFLFKSPFSLSGGEKRLLSIALALATDPDFLLLDESLSGLDYKGYKALRNLLVILHKEKKGVILITHDPSILDLADEVIVMSNGQKEFSGSPSLAMEKGFVEKSFTYLKSLELFSMPILSMSELIERRRNG